MSNKAKKMMESRHLRIEKPLNKPPKVAKPILPTPKPKSKPPTNNISPQIEPELNRLGRRDMAVVEEILQDEGDILQMKLALLSFMNKICKIDILRTALEEVYRTFRKIRQG